MVAPVIVVYPLSELLLVPCLQHVGGLLVAVCGVMLKQIYEKGHLGRHSFTPDVNGVSRVASDFLRFPYIEDRSRAEGSHPRIFVFQ